MARSFAQQQSGPPEVDDHPPSAQVEALREQVDAAPEDAAGWVALAERLADAQQAVEAADSFEQAARLELRDGNFAAALVHLDRAVELAPSRAETHYELAQTHHQLGHFGDALVAYRRAYEHFSSTQRHRRSKEVLDRMTRLKPDDIELQLERARNLEQNGEFKDAMQIYRRCADELERSGRTDKFLEVTEHMLELAPEQPELRATIVETLVAEADAYRNYGLEERVHKTLHRALKHAPDSLDAHLRLVLLHERQRQPMAFMQSVSQMARIAQGGRAMAAKFLRRAHAWMGNEELIAELAQTLEVELNDTNNEMPPCFAQDLDRGLGDEETTPRDKSTPAFSRESTRNHGMILGGAGRAHNLLTLLQSVERCHKPSQLLIEDGEGNSVGELRARDGRLQLGVRIDGKIFVDKPLTRVSTELARRLVGLDHHEELNTSNTTTGERSQLYRLTARALVELASRAESQHFCLRSRSMEPSDEERLSFTPFALTLRAAGYMHSDSSKVAAHFYDELGDASDEAWLLIDPEDGSEMCLPLRSASTAPLPIAQLRSLGRQSYRILEYNRKASQTLGTSDTVSTSFALADGLWCAVSSGAHLALVRTEQHKIGATLSKARRATDRGGEQ